jgi:hypothetical protein
VLQQDTGVNGEVIHALFGLFRENIEIQFDV